MEIRTYIPITPQDANFNNLNRKKLDLFSDEKPEQYLRYCENFSSENKFKFVARQISKIRILVCGGCVALSHQTFFLRCSILFSLLCIIFSLQGCASSGVSREASSQAQSTYQGVVSIFDRNSVDVAEAYQGASQTTKGVMLGATTGAVTGGLVSSWSGVLPGAAGGAILGGALGAYIDSKASVADKIINRGNKVVVLGDQVLIILPSRLVFVGGTPILQPYASQTLNLVSELISGYPNMSVKIAAYTGSNGSERINRSLSQEQANTVLRYLWRTKTNTRMLYAEGGDGSKPVAQQGSDWAGENYRVEITFEKLPV